MGRGADAQRRDRRRAVDELGDPLRARRRDPLPGARLPRGRAGDPPEPGLGRASSRAPARRPSCRGSARRSQEKIVALLETGEIPAATKLKAKFPPTLIEVTRIPGLGAKTVAPAATTSSGVASARRAARGGRGRADPRPQGARPEGRGERARGARAARVDEGPAERLLLSRGAAGRRGARRRRCARTRPPTRVEIAGSARRWAETCKDIDLIATATRPARRSARRSPGTSWSRRRARSARPATRVLTHNGISVDLRIVAPERVRQPAAALHRLEGAQRRAARARRCATGLSVSEHGITETETGEVTRYATEAEVYERLGLRLHRAGAARGPRRDRGGARTGELPGAGRASATSAATCTATRRSPTAATRSSEMAEAARERGYAYLAVTDHSASHGFGNDVSPDAPAGADRGDRPSTTPRPGAASGCWPGPRSTSSRTARSTTTTTCSPRLDWVIASVHTSFRISRGEDDRAGDRRDRAPRRSTASAT